METYDGIKLERRGGGEGLNNGILKFFSSILNPILVEAD